MIQSIEDLHRVAFGYVPEKAGTAYERLAAVVLATLGWQNVEHDKTAGAEGRRARHQLDVTAQDPAGGVQRLVVECKDWSTTVGQSTMNAAVGVRDQLGADEAAVVTTRGFTEGARRVAVDEGIAMVLLAPYDPRTHPGPYVRRVEITIKLLQTEFRNFEVELADPERLRPGVHRVEFHPLADSLLLEDGARAERISDLLRAQSGPCEEGDWRRHATLVDGRFLPLTDGGHVEVRSLSWTEVVSGDESPVSVVSKARGTPVLAAAQLDDVGDTHSGRLVISEDLFAWGIDDAGRVVPRGPIA